MMVFFLFIFIDILLFPEKKYVELSHIFFILSPVCFNRLYTNR